MGCIEPASRGGLGLKARETGGEPLYPQAIWELSLSTLIPFEEEPGLPISGSCPLFYLPVFRDLSVSVCLSFALVEVYTDPAHIRGGGGLHLVWTLRGMGARGNMVWGSGEIAGGGG